MIRIRGNCRESIQTNRCSININNSVEKSITIARLILFYNFLFQTISNESQSRTTLRKLSQIPCIRRKRAHCQLPFKPQSLIILHKTSLERKSNRGPFTFAITAYQPYQTIFLSTLLLTAATQHNCPNLFETKIHRIHLS